MLPLETPWVVYAGSGSRGPFPLAVSGVPISFADKADIQAWRIGSDGVRTLLVEGTDYTLSASSALPDLGDVARTVATASLSLKLAASPIAVGQSILIERITPATQDYALNKAAGFSSMQMERTLDEIVRVQQQLQAAQARGLYINVFDVTPDRVLEAPALADRAGKWFSWDVNGNPAATSASPGYGDLLSTNNLSDLTNPAAARNNLALGSLALLNTSDVFRVANNLSEGNATTMRANLGLGALSLLSVGDTVSVTATAGLTKALSAWTALINALGASPISTAMAAVIQAASLAAGRLALGVSAAMDAVITAASLWAAARQGSYPYRMTNIAALRAATWAAADAPRIVILEYNYAVRDGGGVFFYDEADGSSADDAGCIILTSTPVAALRYRRLTRGASEPVKASWFNADYTTGILAAISANYLHVQVDKDFTLTAKITLTTNCVLEGIGKDKPRITKGANIDMIDMSASQCQIRHLDLRGAGGTYTGKGVIFNSNGVGDQRIDDCLIMDTAGPAVHFMQPDAGARIVCADSAFRCYTLTDPAIVMPTTIDTGGSRYFTNCTGIGGNFMQTNKGLKTHLVGCSIDGLDFSGSTAVGADLRMTITGCRLSIVGGLTIQGGQISLIGCLPTADITLGANSARCTVGPNAAADFTIVDNSTATGDLVNEVWGGHNDSPTIQWKGDTTDPVLGNGTLTCRVERKGRSLKVDVKLVMGSTTTFGSGAWYFLLPAPYSTWAAKADATGIGSILDSGTTYYAVTPKIATGGKQIYMTLDNSPANVYASAPMTWAVNDTLQFSIEFEIS